jgi:steroid delta-isomerase-like uncharacterized protein
MTSHAPAFPYRRYIEKVWNSHDPEALAEYFAPNARDHSLVPGESDSGVGLEYLKERAKALLNAFPDVHFIVEDVVQQDDRLAARVTVEGTHQGEFAGIPATGKRIKVYDFAMYRISEGKFTDVWSLIDMRRLRDQLEA